MGRRSKTKGARGERDAAAFLRQYYPDAARGASQTRGGEDAPDVDNSPYWVEVKFYENLAVEKWVAKAESDSKNSGKEPMVMMRCNRGEWIVAMRASRFFEVVKND